MGLWFREYEKSGMNPVTGEAATAIRRALTVEYDLPIGRQYAELIESFLTTEV